MGTKSSVECNQAYFAKKEEEQDLVQISGRIRILSVFYLKN